VARTTASTQRLPVDENEKSAGTGGAGVWATTAALSSAASAIVDPSDRSVMAGNLTPGCALLLGDRGRQAHLTPQANFDVGRDRRVLPEERLHILTPLAEPIPVVREPRAA